MEITHDVTIDLLRPRQNVIRVVQEDSTRMIRLKLLSNNQNYNVADDLDEGETLLKFVEFRKADGHGGMYDTTSTGETAVELEDQSVGNVWLVALDGQCFTCPGWTQVNVRFETEDGKRIHTFRIMVDVEPTASSDTESTDWGELNSIADLRNAVAELATIVETIAGNTGLTEDMKQAFLACFAHVAWEGTDGQSYIDALEATFYPQVDLLSISAVFEQGQTVIYDTNSLDDLKPMLTVTAHYTDGTSGVVTSYTLSGTLTEGTSTITVSYSGKTATFDVTVSSFDTSPVIVTTGKYRKPNGNDVVTAEGWGITQKYKVRWQKSDIYKLKVSNATSPAVGISAYTGTESNYSTAWSVNGTKSIAVNYTFENCWLESSIKIADIADTYLYNETSGDVVFAGANTPYYGKQNIYE